MTFVDKDDCGSNPCRNNGTCVDGVADFTCQCHGGWKGRTCLSENHHCQDNPCQNGGTCSESADKFVCHCPSGWSGSVCHLGEFFLHLNWTGAYLTITFNRFIDVN